VAEKEEETEREEGTPLRDIAEQLSKLTLQLDKKNNNNKSKNNDTHVEMEFDGNQRHMEAAMRKLERDIRIRRQAAKTPLTEVKPVKIEEIFEVPILAKTQKRDEAMIQAEIKAVEAPEKPSFGKRRKQIPANECGYSLESDEDEYYGDDYLVVRRPRTHEDY